MGILHLQEEVLRILGYLNNPWDPVPEGELAEAVKRATDEELEIILLIAGARTVDEAIVRIAQKMLDRVWEDNG